tara:strand:+ start:191 stop:337 length:147 start_codon:yes stop_codon:yes gene_type:complete
MAKRKCKKKGGTFKEACRAIFKAGCGGWVTYQCETCKKWHIMMMPKKY